MFRTIGSRLSYANVMATVAVFIGLGGGAYAVSGIPGQGGVFHGCVSNKTGLLRVVKTARACRKAVTHGKNRNPGEFAVSWNQQGPAGNPGAPGTQGAPGAPATRLWAVVNSAGTLLRGSGAVAAAPAAGGYEVDFDRDVSSCSYQATLGATSAEVGEVGVGPRSTNHNGVFVLTSDSAGGATAHGFNLSVFC